MITFVISVIVLIGGYWVYGKFVDRVFGTESDRMTPALSQTDGVDYVPMGTARIFLIQLLNIAGLGPIFGAISGALWGPVVFIWIVFGCIFAGGVHDFMSGMLSVRNNGISISEIVGKYLGSGLKIFVRVFSVVLLILVGTVFVVGPAKLLESLTPQSLNLGFWVTLIIIYYFLATILPIDKLIGRIYPVFAVLLVIMAVGIIGGIICKGYHLPELTLSNLHPKSLSVWPLMFITVACGAISGFHATQSPMMARCLKNEKDARKVFYGAMIAEGLIALIWAAGSIAFFGSTEGLGQQLAAGSPGGVVHKVSVSLLGSVGGVLAILGVVVCPVTSGDTAFRSARLTIADAFKINQNGVGMRLAIAVPLLSIGFFLTKVKFDIIWRYFAWSNQTLAMMVLWAAAVYLKRQHKFHWIATIPAVFMSVVTVSYILQAPEGLRMSWHVASPIGIGFGIILLVIFMIKKSNQLQDRIIPTEPGLQTAHVQ